jgi:LemA protein
MWALVGLLLVALALWVALKFNGFVRDRNLVREAWSGIDVQLKRRHSVVPNLVRTVQGYAAHEKKLFEEVTARRASALRATGPADRAEPENALSTDLRSLMAVAEAYPDLKADAGFLDLQQSLSRVEDQIQLARRYYNGSVRNYNTGIQSFPGNLVAGLFGFKPAEFFEIQCATERTPPDVDLRVEGAAEP